MCNILQLSQILVHQTPATSNILPRFDSIEIKVVFLKGTRDVGTIFILIPSKVSALSLFPKDVRKTSPRQVVSGRV